MQASECELKVMMLYALAGERAIYRTLLEHLRPRFGPFFARQLREMPSEVDDLVLETLIAIHAKRETFDHDQPCLLGRRHRMIPKLIDYFGTRGVGGSFGWRLWTSSRRGRRRCDRSLRRPAARLRGGSEVDES